MPLLHVLKGLAYCTSLLLVSGGAGLNSTKLETGVDAPRGDTNDCRDGAAAGAGAGAVKNIGRNDSGDPESGESCSDCGGRGGHSVYTVDAAACSSCLELLRGDFPADAAALSGCAEGRRDGGLEDGECAAVDLGVLGPVSSGRALGFFSLDLPCCGADVFSRGMTSQRPGRAAKNMTRRHSALGKNSPGKKNSPGFVTVTHKTSSRRRRPAAAAAAVTSGPPPTARAPIRTIQQIMVIC